ASVETLTTHDQKTAVVDAPMPAGALHLGDLGFYKLKRFVIWNEQGVYWLTRLKVGTSVFTPDGDALDLLAHLEGAASSVTLPVRLGVKARLSVFLVADRIPDD